MRIAIIGAGLSGLACAFRLEQQGFNGTLDIYEKKPSVGAGNIFLEFISELFHRPINDLFVHLANEYKLYLLPHQTIYKSQSFGPTRSSIFDGFLGHIVVRGNHENSLEKQLARQIKTPIQYNQNIQIQELEENYDIVIVATGKLQDIPIDVGIRIDRYVNFYHALIKGNFDDKMTKVWFNNKYADKGYAFLLPFDESTAMISVTTPNQNFDLAQGWKLFIDDVFSSNSEEFIEIHQLNNFAMGQPNRYAYKNLLFIGNVAGCVTPAMGFGLHNAILSGLYAADAIIKNIDYEKLMSHMNKEYKLSLALRNALEQMGDSQYDLMIDGINTILGRAILRKKGLNLHNFGARLLSMLTNETKNSSYPNVVKEFTGKTIYKNNKYE